MLKLLVLVLQAFLALAGQSVEIDMVPLALGVVQRSMVETFLVPARALPEALKPHVQLLFRKIQFVLLQVLLWEIRSLTRPLVQVLF